MTSLFRLGVPLWSLGSPCVFPPELRVITTTNPCISLSLSLSLALSLSLSFSLSLFLSPPLCYHNSSLSPDSERTHAAGVGVYTQPDRARTRTSRFLSLSHSFFRVLLSHVRGFALQRGEDERLRTGRRGRTNVVQLPAAGHQLVFRRVAVKKAAETRTDRAGKTRGH